MGRVSYPDGWQQNAAEVVMAILNRLASEGAAMPANLALAVMMSPPRDPSYSSTALDRLQATGWIRIDDPRGNRKVHILKGVHKGAVLQGHRANAARDKGPKLYADKHARRAAVFDELSRAAMAAEPLPTRTEMGKALRMHLIDLNDAIRWLEGDGAVRVVCKSGEWNVEILRGDAAGKATVATPMPANMLAEVKAPEMPPERPRLIVVKPESDGPVRAELLCDGAAWAALVTEASARGVKPGAILSDAVRAGVRFLEDERLEEALTSMRGRAAR